MDGCGQIITSPDFDGFLKSYNFSIRRKRFFLFTFISWRLGGLARIKIFNFVILKNSLLSHNSMLFQYDTILQPFSPQLEVSPGEFHRDATAASAVPRFLSPWIQ